MLLPLAREWAGGTLAVAEEPAACALHIVREADAATIDAFRSQVAAGASRRTQARIADAKGRCANILQLHPLSHRHILTRRMYGTRRHWTAGLQRMLRVRACGSR